MTMTTEKPHASDRIAFPAQGGVPRFVGEVTMFDAERNFGMVAHVLPTGKTVKIFFHLDECKFALQENNKIYVGQVMEYSVRRKKLQAHHNRPTPRDRRENLKAVDCVLLQSEQKMTNAEIAAFLDGEDNG